MLTIRDAFDRIDLDIVENGRGQIKRRVNLPHDRDTLSPLPAARSVTSTQAANPGHCSPSRRPARAASDTAPPPGEIPEDASHQSLQPTCCHQAPAGSVDSRAPGLSPCRPPCRSPAPPCPHSRAAAWTTLATKTPVLLQAASPAPSRATVGDVAPSCSLDLPYPKEGRPTSLSDKAHTGLFNHGVSPIGLAADASCHTAPTLRLSPPCPNDAKGPFHRQHTYAVAFQTRSAFHR